MYEATGLEYWIYKPANDKAMRENFFTCFWAAKKQLTNFVNSGGVFRYNLVNYKGDPVPFIYNSL